MKRLVLAWWLILAVWLVPSCIAPACATVATTHIQNSFTGNGSQTSFNFTFRILAATDLIVTVNSSQIDPSQYTATVNSNGVGGTVVFNSAPANGAAIIIKRATPKTQLTGFPLEARLDSRALERAYDKNMLAIQEVSGGSGGGGSGGHVIRNEGVDLTGRTGLNIIGSGINAADDGAGDETEITLDPELNAIASLSTTGIYARTAADTIALRTIMGTGGQIGVSNGDGVGGNPTLTFTGIMGHTIRDEGTDRTARTGLNFIGAGIAATDDAGGNETEITLDAELNSIAGLSATGIYARTAADTIALRTITGTGGQIGVSNGDGVGGNPTLSLPDPVILPGTNALTIPVGTTAQRPANGAGKIRFNTTDGKFEYNDGSAWIQPGTGGGGTPGGSDTQVQFNDGGAFGGDAGLVYAKATDKLTLAGALKSVTQVEDTNANEVLKFSSVASAVNYLQVANSATTNNVQVSSQGDDTNVPLEFLTKGSGIIFFSDKVCMSIPSFTTSIGNTILNLGTVTGSVSPQNYLEIGADLSGNPVVIFTQSTVDSDVNLKLNLKGAGSLDVDTSKIINVVDPASAQDAATKNYVDTRNFIRFGGDGSDGAVTKGTTSDTIKQINATTFTQTVSTTYTPDAGVIVNCNSTATFNGTTTVGNLGNGGVYKGTRSPPQGGGDGGGPGGGTAGFCAAGTSEGGGGGGGGFGNSGGNGGNSTNGPGEGGAGGTPYPAGAFMGGSGGGPGGDGGTTNGGNGGHGGGSFRVLAASTITIASGAIVQANGSTGSAGVNDENGGGGGGSGGFEGFYSLSGIVLTGDIKCLGADGGAASAADAGEGGGGAGGRAIRMSPSNTGAGAVTVTGGQGDGNTGNNGTDGGASVSTSITGTPNLPVIAHVESSVALDLICRIHQFRSGDDWGSTVNLTHQETAEAIAALHCRPGQFANLTATLMQGGVTYEELCEQTTFDCSGWADAIDAAARHETAWR